MGDKKKPEGKPLNKSELREALANDPAVGLDKKTVGRVIDGLERVIRTSLKQSGCFMLHGLLKIKKKHVPARPARRGINPFTKEEQDFAAKPAKNVVKVMPLKKLKDMV